jgi:hypothetical protein
MQSGRIFYGRIWLKNGCSADDDDDDDNYDDDDDDDDDDGIKTIIFWDVNLTNLHTFDFLLMRAITMNSEALMQCLLTEYRPTVLPSRQYE